MKYHVRFFFSYIKDTFFKEKTNRYNNYYCVCFLKVIFNKKLQCKVKGIPSTLQLFTISLPQGGCIIWELAVAFSPRRSETAEKLLEYETGEAGAEIAGGKIYSELIRVWNIVLKHADFRRCVHKIVSSHQRGESCIIQVTTNALFSGSQIKCSLSQLFKIQINQTSNALKTIY